MFSRVLRAASATVLDTVTTSEVCNSVLSDENDERCINMECDANYQCASRNCNDELTCQPFEEDSKYSGLVILIIFSMIIAFILTFAIFKLCRKSQNQKFFAKMILNNAADKEGLVPK